MPKMARTTTKKIVIALSFFYDKGLINAKWLKTSFYHQSTNMLYPDRVQPFVGLICLQPVCKDYWQTTVNQQKASIVFGVIGKQCRPRSDTAKRNTICRLFQKPHLLLKMSFADNFCKHYCSRSGPTLCQPDLDHYCLGIYWGNF